jgi:hypothetical protein
MGTKTKKKKVRKPKRPYDNFLDRDHSNDPFVLRKLENAYKTLGDGSCIQEIMDKYK